MAANIAVAIRCGIVVSSGLITPAIDEKFHLAQKKQERSNVAKIEEARRFGPPRGCSRIHL
jgi:hypothetical protein